MCLAYDPKQRPSAQARTLLRGLPTGREIVIQHLASPVEYEAALLDFEGLLAQLNSATEGASSCGADTTTTIKVKTQSTLHSYRQTSTFPLANQLDMHFYRTSPGSRSPRLRRLGCSWRSGWRRSIRPTNPAFHPQHRTLPSRTKPLPHNLKYHTRSRHFNGHDL